LYAGIKAAQVNTPLLNKSNGVTLDITYTVGDKRKHDLDNFFKGTLDSLTGVLYEDDGQVIALNARKVFKLGKQETIITWSVN
jgi:Holliday junction resolvase RusA-like endonuclease